MQRAARLLAQSLRAAQRQQGGGCRRGFSASAAEVEVDASQGDSRVMAYALGALGAVPFIALSTPGFAHVQRVAADAGAPLPISAADAPRLQIAYGASILTFLGAPHWGLAMTNFGAAGPIANVVRYAWGVTPSLLAFPLPCLPQQPAIPLLVQGLGVAFMADAFFLRANLLPSWYFWHLRVPLTLVACGSLLATAAAAPAQPAEPAAPVKLQPAAPDKAGRRWW